LRRRLGYLPQDFGVYDNLTAFEFLSYFAALKGIHSKTRVMEMLETVNLHTVAHRTAGDFSGGMKQRLGIAQALINDPELLIVDEPTAVLPSTVFERIRDEIRISSAVRKPDGIHVRIVDPQRPVSEAQEVKPNLEDAFLFHMNFSIQSVT
jgi:ABC-type multidrug transport system ATPase subunit